MKAVYLKHCARKGTTPEKMIAKINRESSLRIKQKRVFPTVDQDLRSTKAYVEAYYRVNCGVFGHEPVGEVNGRYFGGKLSESPTEWPEGPDVILTTEE